MSLWQRQFKVVRVKEFHGGEIAGFGKSDRPMDLAIGRIRIEGGHDQIPAGVDGCFCVGFVGFPNANSCRDSTDVGEEFGADLFEQVSRHVLCGRVVGHQE